MLYRTPRKTGEKVTVPGYGCMRLPTVGNDYSKVDDAAALKLVRHAVDNGVNYIDTSWPYHGADDMKEGASEPFVGKTVREIGRDNDCGECSWQCPQGIDIPTQLRKVARRFAEVKAGW